MISWSVGHDKITKHAGAEMRLSGMPGSDMVYYLRHPSSGMCPVMEGKHDSGWY